MSRAIRLEYPGALYHVMNRGVARTETFLEDDDRRHFLNGLGLWVGQGELVIHAFCLMPNHYHLLAQTPHGGLSRLMRHVDGDYVRMFNHKHRRVGHLWQGRYKAILVEDGPYMLECSRYIHLNPNRAQLTRPAERYRWSSYRNYIGGPAVVDWVRTGTTLESFGGDRKKYRAFVEAGRGERPVSPFEHARAGLILGGEAFLRKALDLLGARKKNPELSGRATLGRLEKRPPEEVEAQVQRLFGEETPRRRRRMALYALRKHSRLTATEVARRCGRTPGAVTLAMRDLDAEALNHPDLRRRLRLLTRALGAPEIV